MVRTMTDSLKRLKQSGTLDKIISPRVSDAGRELLLTDITPDSDQPRRMFDAAKLAGLADSIRVQGVLQPITVQPVNGDGKYVIIMGERRWRAAQLAGLEKIPALVREASAELRAIQLTENIQRADLTVMEIARAVEQMKVSGGSREDIAKALGWSTGEVSRFSSVMNMPPALQFLAESNVSIRTLSDLYGIWKSHPEAAERFIRSVSPEDISRIRVADFRKSLEPEEQEQEQEQEQGEVGAMAPTHPDGAFTTGPEEASFPPKEASEPVASPGTLGHHLEGAALASAICAYEEQYCRLVSSSMVRVRFEDGSESEVSVSSLLLHRASGFDGAA